MGVSWSKVRSTDQESELKQGAAYLSDKDGKIEASVNLRNAARAAKNFAESDRIRDELLAQGIVLKDGPSGTTWEVKR